MQVVAHLVSPGWQASGAWTLLASISLCWQHGIVLAPLGKLAFAPERMEASPGCSPGRGSIATLFDAYLQRVEAARARRFIQA